MTVARTLRDKMADDGGIRNVEKDIVPVDEIFALQGMARVKWDEGRFLR